MESLVEIRKILVPVDYSTCSNLASRYALKIARRSKAEILFFHAFYSPAYDLIELTGNKVSQKKLKAEVTSKLMESEEKEMAQFLQSLEKLPEIKSPDIKKIHSDIRPGLAKEEIQKICAEFEPDLVVMGTHGSDSLDSSILGSMTEFAIKKLKYPVLAVPENYTFIGEQNIKKIAYLTDFDETDFASIKKLMGLTALLDLTICCVHVGGKSGNWERLKMDGLKNYFSSTYEQTQVECEILSTDENILQAIDNFVKENNINMLSLTTRRRNLIEKLTKPSLTKKLFYHSRIPLLVFHS